MLIKLFGLLDILVGLSLVLLRFDLFPIFSLIFGIYLIIKALIFIKSGISIIDLISGVIVIISFLGFFSVLSWIVVVSLIQKGLFSIIS